MKPETESIMRALAKVMKSLEYMPGVVQTEKDGCFIKGVVERFQGLWNGSVEALLRIWN